ncbi:spore germination protein [Melghirimyces algeriensis]|uniref:Spore germination protein KA/spore germination protein n=1 Tax=Melghirimyces algeriensis TaxID=910412 RepID=A0A521BII8_9BACL|nr:spore germination protein [Melghirimyces algeriensis]SMO46913.1 spore germination protein KA/spore germination protein [Melghirimyces algeriensis]
MRTGWQRRRSRKKKKMWDQRSKEQLDKRVGDQPVHMEIERNVEFIGKVLGDSSDLITRWFTIQYIPDRRAVLMCVDGLVDKRNLDQFVLAPLMTRGEQLQTKTDLWMMVNESLVAAEEKKKSSQLKETVDSLLSGDAILFVDGYSEGLIIGAKGWEKRGVEDPRAEAVVRGPREGLTETLRVNTGMIRRRLKDPDLRLKDFKVGERTKTNLTMMFIQGIVDDTLVKEIEKRIQEIRIDSVLESGYIEEMIGDATLSPFPVLQNTERPDAVVAHLLEGKVGILVDGTPHVLIAPAVFTQFYSSPEDYYERYMIATFLRLLRLVAFFIALLLPALYIAFISFHPEMIPSKLAIALAAGRSTVPFPSIVEALMMEMSVEILREASIRLPGPIGPTIGIVGALVIGEAAVTAGVVSPLMVIVVGLTTISSYANPNYSAAISIRLLRFPMMIVASILGLYGLVIALLLLLLHMIKLRSFGVPYMAPFAPLRIKDVKDTLIRIPWPFMNKRPSIFRPVDDQREDG